MLPEPLPRKPIRAPLQSKSEPFKPSDEPSALPSAATCELQEPLSGDESSVSGDESSGGDESLGCIKPFSS